MAADAVCAVDVGSTVIKSAVYGESLNLLGAARTDFPAVRSAFRAEADLDLIWDAFASTVRAAMATAGKPPVRLVLSAQMAGLILLDAYGRAVRPAILGVDQRGELPVAADTRTGCPRAAIYPAGKLRWLAAQEPGLVDAARYVGGIKEYLLWRLTGAWITDPASASATGLYDVFAHRWLPPHAHRCGVKVSQLPELGAPVQDAGVTSAAAAAECGLPGPATTLVGLGDGPAANLSCGAVGPSRLCVSLGTTVVARLLVRSADLPNTAGPMFVQHVMDDWYCTGVRFDTVGDRKLAPLGASGPRVTLAELPSALELMLQTIRELRPVGSHQDPESLSTLAETWGRPVRMTASPDGTRGTASLARPPASSSRLDAVADRVPITGEIPCRQRSRSA